jgi:hypothetical protein
MLAGKGGDFAAIAADGHRTPAAAVRARFVVEKKAAVGIGTQPETCLGTLGDQFRRRTSHGGQQPVEAALARDELDLPGALAVKQFIVTFGNPKDLVDGFGPIQRYFLLPVHGDEHLVERGTEALRLSEQAFRGLRVGLGQSQKLDAALGRHDSRGFQE